MFAVAFERPYAFEIARPGEDPAADVCCRCALAQEAQGTSKEIPIGLQVVAFAHRRGYQPRGEFDCPAQIVLLHGRRCLRADHGTPAKPFDESRCALGRLKWKKLGWITVEPAFDAVVDLTNMMLRHSIAFSRDVVGIAGLR